MDNGDNLTEFEPNENANGKGKALIIQPYGTRYYALFEGEDLICVTVYKKGALEVKRRLEMVSDSEPKEG
jgi:hypothetical protein